MNVMREKGQLTIFLEGTVEEETRRVRKGLKVMDEIKRVYKKDQRKLFLEQEQLAFWTNGMNERNVIVRERCWKLLKQMKTQPLVSNNTSREWGINCPWQYNKCVAVAVSMQ